MPVYEYQCSSCGDHFERRQKYSDGPVTECPSCGGQVQKLISSAAFTLKGGGWYSDLYASRRKEAPAGEATRAAPSAEKASGGDAAPAAGTGKAEEKPTARPAAAAPAGPGRKKAG